MATVGERIRAARERAGLTRADLADESGLDRTTVYFLENGRHVARRAVVEKIAIALRVNVSELMGE